ncbi:MAG: lysylphosphatidylglycerol synthase transmembrane domain-containing protein [Phycisphaerae bacterium]
MSKSKKGKVISYTLRFAVAGGALYLAFRNVDFSSVGGLLMQLSIWALLAGLAGWMANQVLFVSRWYYLLRVQSIDIGFWPAFKLHFLGIFYNNCLPSAVGGDLLRAWYVTNHTDKKVEAVTSVFVDRLVGISAMILMGVISYWFIPAEATDLKEPGNQPAEQSFLAKITEYWWVLAIIVGVLVLALLVMLATKKGRAILRHALHLVYSRLLGVVGKVHKSLMVYYRNKLALVFALLISFACQGIFIVGLYFVGRGLGMETPAKYYFVFFPIAWIIGAIPVSVGGIGVWEGFLIASFVAMGDKIEPVAALALFHRALWLFGSLPGVIIHMSGAHLPKDFSIDENLPPS